MEKTNKRLKQFMEDQVEEIKTHKWIESEKAHKDLGDEAVKDWIKNYAAEYRKHWEEENGEI